MPNIPRPLDPRLPENVFTDEEGNKLNLQRRLGSGVRGETFRVTNKDGVELCLKRETSKKRALREAAAIQDCYGHATKVTEVGGCFYYTMPFFEGHTLKDHITQGLTFYEKIAIAEQLRDQLSQIHAAGYLHRDIKPDNIIVNIQDGEVTTNIIDLGRSVTLGSTYMPINEPRISLLFQRPVAPEYLSSTGVIGTHSDMYSFGKIFAALFPADLETIQDLTSDSSDARVRRFEDIDASLKKIFDGKKQNIIAELDRYLDRAMQEPITQNLETAMKTVVALRGAVDAAQYNDRGSITELSKQFDETTNYFQTMRINNPPTTLWDHIMDLLKVFGLSKGTPLAPTLDRRLLL